MLQCQKNEMKTVALAVATLLLTASCGQQHKPEHHHQGVLVADTAGHVRPVFLCPDENGGPTRDGHCGWRMFLGHAGNHPQTSRRGKIHRGLHRWNRAESDLRAGLHPYHRPCRGGGGGV